MKARKNRLDIALNVLCLVVLAGMSVYLAAAWRSIPDTVPSHYGPSGAIDRYGSKNGLVTVSLVAWGVYILFTAIRFIPKSMWNTAFAESEEERERVIILSAHLLESEKLAVVLLFAYYVITAAAGAGFSVLCVLAVVAAALVALFYWLGRIIRIGKR